MKSGIRSFFRRTAAAALALAAAFCLAFSTAEDTEEEIDWGEDVDVEIEMPAYLKWAVDTEWHTPSENSPVHCEHENCYWNYPMGQLDEDGVWKLLTAPVTVLDGNERHQCAVRARPDGACEEYTGMVTYTSQGVHVLRNEGEWTLIEAYSSSPEGSEVKVYATLFQGYVKTSLLKEVQVDQKYGLVIDKQTQRLYLFQEGKLLTTMLCSTGFYNPKKKNPWNETPAGEFLMVSWTGRLELKDDDGETNMICEHAIRINDGILLHEVPKIPKTDDAGNVEWSYTRCERYLGEKASHGCIRVQRRKTPEGINEEWLWKNLSNGTKKGQDYTKVIIWDDAGRMLDYPDDSLELYYNSKRDKGYYHSSPKCERIKGSSKTITFTYGELEDKAYKKLAACPNCAPQPRKSGIDTLNEKNNR